MSLATFKKRGGTNLRGKEYEWLLCALYSLKFSTCPAVSDFQLCSNNEIFGKFDDISLEVKYKNGESKNFLLQLKHAEQAQSLALSSLSAPSGNFSLSVYKQSFKNTAKLPNCFWILYTNKSTGFKDQTKITVENEDVFLGYHTCVADGLLNTSHSERCSVFKFHKETDDEFMSNVYLYSNQQNDTNLKRSVSDLLKTTVNCDIYTTFVEFMRGWWSGNFILTKNDVVAKIAELVFGPYIKTLSAEESNDATKLLEDAILTCDLTVTNESKVTKIWTRDEQNVDIKTISLTALKFGLITQGISNIGQLSEEKKAKVLWFMNRAPLVVDVDESKKEEVVSTISLFENCEPKKKVVLVGEFSKADFPGFKIFRNFSDIAEPGLQEKIAKTLTCSLQGRPRISLEQLGVEEILQTEELLGMATSEDFTIAEPLETLPPAYISRSFYKILLNYKVIDALQKSKILLSYSGRSDIQKNFRKLKININHRMREAPLYKYYIFANDNEFGKDEIRDEFSCGDNCHHFRMVDSQHVQWLDSNIDIDELRKYKIVNQTFTEAEIDDHFHNRIKLLTSHTGTGKTSFLNHLKNEAPPDHLVIKMNLKEHSDFFKTCTFTSNVWEYIVEFTSKLRNYNTFEKEIVKNFDKDRTTILWDGFDDLRESSRDGFVESVLSLRKLGLTQWITAQNRLQKLLETKFAVFAMTLVPFSRDEQIWYIQQRCGVSDDAILKNFFENMQIIEDQEYLGLPLQLYILTDIFSQDCALLETVYTLTDMFAAFIDGKYTHFLRIDGDKNFEDFENLIEDAKLHRLSQYKIAAVATYLPELFARLHLKNSPKFIKDIKGGDFLDIIERMDDDGGFIFSHQMLGHYLAASYLAENLPSGLSEFLFDETCRNIRFMFDLLLADNKSTFVAVLYRKFDRIETYMIKDGGGRNPLHLLSSYGKEHPKDLRSIERDSEDFKEIVKSLSQVYDPFEKDDLFNWSCYDYADRSLSLGVIETLGSNLKSVIPKLKNYELSIILYYSVMLNYENIFRSSRNIPYFEDKDKNNLLHLATEFDRKEYLSRLLKEQNYVQSINKPNEDRWTPLHYATFNGNFGLVKFLVKKGASLILQEPSVMSLAASKGRKDIVEYFLTCGLSPNEFYHKNHFSTSIFQAVHQKFEDIVDLLLKNGAKLFCVNRSRYTGEKPNPYGMNIFHMLLENQQFAEADAVLKRGIHVDSVDYHGRTALHHAASANQEVVVRFLFARGANHRVTDHNGQNPVHAAAKVGAIEVAKLLLEKGADSSQEDEELMTPLHVSAMWGQSSFTSFLLETGVEANMRNKFGRTPLHLAALHDVDECIEILVHSGGNIEEREDLYGRTPLHLAAWMGNDDSIKSLLKHGAQVQASCNFGFTPLHLAVEESRESSCQLLIGAGASLDVRNRNGHTPLNLLDKTYTHMCRFIAKYDKQPLHTAVLRQDLDFICELVSLGYDVNAADSAGNTPLHLAVTLKTAKLLVVTLIRLGADVTKQNHHGSTPLHYALQDLFCDMEVVEALLAADKENRCVDCSTIFGVTPLHLAAESMILEDKMTKLLIEKGAKVDSCNEDGMTALHCAAACGNLDAVRVLVKQESDIDRTDKFLQTPLHLAIRGGHLKTVQFLKKNSFGGTCYDVALKHEHPKIIKLFLSGDPSLDACKTNDKGRNVLHVAAKKGSLDLVKFFVEKVPIDIADNDGTTPIEEALFNSRFDVFEFLLSKTSFDVNKFSQRYKRYPLHVVACINNLNLVQRFVGRGAKIDVTDEDGNTPLHNAFIYSCDKLLDFLLDCDLSVGRVVNIKNNKGETVLHLAVGSDCSNKKGILQKLITRGADVNSVDLKGDSCFDLLFEAGELNQNILRKVERLDVNRSMRKNKRTLLHEAVLLNDVCLIEWLVEKGASIDSEDVDGDTPMHFAANSDLKTLTLLLDKFKDFDINRTNTLGETVLHLAALRSLDNVQELVRRGASLIVPNKYGQIPLHYALKKPPIFQFLCAKTPNVDIFNVAGHMSRTVLHEAAYRGDLKLVKYFLQIGFRFNEPDDEGKTPLNEAVKQNKLEVLEFLLQQDVDNKVVNICNRRGWSLLHVAANNGSLKLAKLLVKYKAKIDVYNDDGQSPYDLAEENEYHRICKFLKEGDSESEQKCSLS